MTKHQKRDKSGDWPPDLSRRVGKILKNGVSQHFLEQGPEMTREDDVVIADGIGEEIGGLTGIGQTDHLLGTAEVGLGEALDEFALSNEAAGEVASHLEDGDGSGLHIAPNAHTDARFIVGVELVALHHVERDSAMGEEQFTRRGIDTCGIGLEA